MNKLTSTIKFIASNLDQSNIDQFSLAQTGDFNFTFVITTILLAIVCAFAAIVLLKKKVTVSSHLLKEYKGNFFISLITILLFILTIFSALFAFDNVKASADENNGLIGGEELNVIVDMQTGNITFPEATITNIGQYPYIIRQFNLQKVCATNLDNVIWKITIDNNIVCNNKIGNVEEFIPFAIDAGASVKVKVEASGLTGDFAKSLVGQNIAQGITKYDLFGPVQNPYCGRVETLDITTQDVAKSAKLTFVQDNRVIDASITDDNGYFTFSIAKPGLSGVVHIEYTDTSQGNLYSDEPLYVYTYHVSDLGCITIRKLTSLGVKLWDTSNYNNNYIQRDTFWCPAFIDNSIGTDVLKFYDHDRCLVKPTGKNGTYLLSDMCNTENDSKMNAQYVAFCKTGITLQCYQTVDETWDNTFGDQDGNPMPTDKGGVAKSILSNFWLIGGTSKRVDSDAFPNKEYSSKDTIYFNSDMPNIANKWFPYCDESYPVPPAVINGLDFGTFLNNKMEYTGFLKAYGKNDNGKYNTCLSHFSYLPYSAVAGDKDHAWVWDTGVFDTHYTYGGCWLNQIRFNCGFGIVLTQAFSS